MAEVGPGKLPIAEKANVWIVLLGLLGSFASIIGLALVFFPMIHTDDDTLARIRKTKKLKVGYIPYYDITSREAKNGEVKGFLVDVLLKIADDLGVPEENIEFVETDWQNFGLGLREGKYDLSIAGTFKTPERERVAAFTEAIFHLGNGALVRKEDNRFKTILDFNHEYVTLAVVQGEQGYEYARRHLSRARLKVITGADLSLACLEVEKGLADAALSDQYILSQYILKMDSAKQPAMKDALALHPYHVLPVAWAVRKSDQAWLEYLNNEIAILKNSGWMGRLQAGYPMIPWAKAADAKITDAASKSTIHLLRQYIKAFSQGLLYTVVVSSGAIILGTALGAILALVLASHRRGGMMAGLRLVVNAYVYSFLAIPALVLIIMMYYNSYISGLNSVVAATIALGLNLSPFAAKIIASGIRNIPNQYLMAARAFGYSDREIAFEFKFPLVRRSSMQALLVQWFTTVKLSSLASVIGVTEVLHRSQQVIRETYQTERAYMILVVCYMLIVIPIAIVADHYERTKE